MSDIKKKIINIFKSNLKINGKFNENSRIYSLKKWDSLANFNILMQIEKDLKISFNNKEFSELSSFKSIYSNVKKKTKSK